MVQVMLDAAGEPRWVVLSQHHGGTRRSWQRAPLRGETHPLVYVALGSHANYFWGAEAYPNGTSIGSARIEIMDRTGSSDQAMPEVILIPGREQAEADPGQWPGLEWLSYRGRWGEIGIQSDFGGPYGPADKGEQWERPHAWGMDQPLDVEAWYANRLRVEVIGQAAEGARVTLRDAKGAALPPAELLGSLALLHADPAPGQTLVAEVEVPPAQPYALLVAWPDRESSQVTRYVFEDVPSSAALTLRSDAPPVLVVQGRAGELSPKTIEVEAATWDVPDLVWLAGRMPASDVVRGFGISLLAGLAPTALYVGLLYWADRYEKEPKAMLAAAFLWGALPALLVAVAARLFFQVPVQLVGPQAIEAVRAGLVAPLIGEALKGAVVVWIALRYPLEFDNVLDGIIYGAMVGFGFAMTGNTLSYLGSFLLRGFDGLSSTIFIEGVLYGLNHALYTALFGAGLGYARLARQRWQRWAVPLVAFGMAVTGHASHNLALSRAIGLNLWTAAVTWAGVVLIVVVMVWSLQQQRRWLVAELAGEVPEEVYRAMTARRGRARASWQALRQRGFGGWRQARRVHQQCAELSAKKAQRRRRPDEPGLAQEIERLRSEIADLLS